MRSLTIAALFVLLGSFAVPATIIHAQSVGSGTATGGSVGSGTVAPPGANTTLVNPLKITCTTNGTCLSSFLTSILDFVINIGTIIVILMLVFVGFKFVAAQGAPAEIEKAKSMLLWTVIGALILLGSKAISLGILATVKALGS